MLLTGKVEKDNSSLFAFLQMPDFVFTVIFVFLLKMLGAMKRRKPQ